MRLLNLQENYSRYSQDETPLIEIKTLKRRQIKRPAIAKNKILFVIEGDLMCSWGDHPETKIEKGQFFFLPSGEKSQLKAISKSFIVEVCMQKGTSLWEDFKIEDLYKTNKENREKDYKQRANGISPLEINKPLWLYLSVLTKGVEELHDYRFYHEIKIKEMFILLRFYYPHEELRELFNPILSPDTEFSEYVRKIYQKNETAKAMAEAMNITPKLFSRKFKKVYGKTFSDWKRTEKARQVYSELGSGYKPIMQIADEYGFSSQPHLNKFCLREFGVNPGEIRKRRKL